MSEMPASTTVPLRSGQAYDAVIVGARAAGAATALLLARAGLRVLVIDRGAYGTDTLSTHALMRGGVVQLHKWGLLSALEDTPAIRWTSFCYPDVTLRIPIKPSTQAPSLLAPRRYLLDRILVDAAVAAGAELRFGVSFVDLTRDNGRVTGLRLRSSDGPAVDCRANIVVGADGRHSAVARAAGAATLREGPHRVRCDLRLLAGGAGQRRIVLVLGSWRRSRERFRRTRASGASLPASRTIASATCSATIAALAITASCRSARRRSSRRCCRQVRRRRCKASRDFQA